MRATVHSQKPMNKTIPQRLSMARSNKARTKGVLVAGFLALTLGACTQTAMAPQEGIGYRQARFAELETVRAFRACHEEVLTLDRQAQGKGDPAVYLSSAKLAENCERDLGSNAASLQQEERMRNYALVVQNYLKGGDIRAARESLDSFKVAFDGYDLYLTGGASFVDTMDLLLGNVDVPGQPNLALLNAEADLKDEMRRAVRWGGI